jgi:glycosyltransferase involved in cell wall biosynthesis
MTSVLYISYDGLLEPLGQSQVLGYVEPLSRRHAIHILSFEKPADRSDVDAMAAMRARLAAQGIGWTPLTYHKRPSAPATAFDIAQGTRAALGIAHRHKVRILHVRSYVPAMMALGVLRFHRLRFLFDMRGFWADERVDGGLWPDGGRLYRIAKSCERRFLERADHVVTLTHASAAALAARPELTARATPVSVIPTCADLARFVPPAAPPAPPFTFGYVGSIGTWYLFPETLAAFRAVLERRPDARLLLVNRNEHDAVRAALAAAGLPPDRIELVAARHAEVPGLVQRMHAAAALIRPCYSKIASAPTKLAEYLGCGVPCLGNDGVGDVHAILEENRVGVSLAGFAEGDIAAGVDRLLALAGEPETRARCRATAERLFSVADGVAAYDRIYRTLAGEAEAEPQRQERAAAEAAHG